MKHEHYLSALILMMSLTACGPQVTFEESQPADTESLSEFPKRLRGSYVSLADQSTLILGDKIIQRVSDFDELMHPNQLDSQMLMKGDSLIDLRTKGSIPFARVGDSIRLHFHYVDTVFRIGERQVLKKYRGHYFLNLQYAGKSWEVRKMALSKGQLSIGTISSQEEIARLKEVAESSMDTVPPYRFKASKRQFRQFVRNGGFSSEEVFIKQ